jgi:hypothetical protein
MKTLQAEQLRSKGFCTVIEAADALGVHISSMYRAVYRHDVKGTQIGRARYIDVLSLIEYAQKKDKDALSKLDALRMLVGRTGSAVLNRKRKPFKRV